MFWLYSVLIISNYAVQSFELQKAATKCPRQCECRMESIATLPLTKWLTIPMNKYWQQNDSLYENQVFDDDEELILGHNPTLDAAFCVYQQNKEIMEDDFTLSLEALTLLMGPDSFNKTIDEEISIFPNLITLDIQGYTVENADDQSYLKHTALLNLHHLQYVNIQRIRLLPNLNVKNQTRPIPVQEYVQKHSNQTKHNLTFVIPNQPEILPYEEYRTQNLVISTFSNLPNLKFLRLFECNLENISWEMFDGLYTLETLSLEGNRITKIPEFAFYGMPKLKNLILSRNGLSTMNSKSLAGLFELEHLDLSKNNLKYLTDNTFAPLLRLYSLDIRHNPIVKISSGTFEVTNMTKILFISNNNDSLALEDKSLHGLNELEKLLITGLNISALEKSLLTGARNLQYLKLEGKIEFINFDSFTGSPQLEILILNHCHLKYVSMDAFYGLFNLKSLDLSNNELQILPTGVFDELESLRELLLTGNKLTTLPDNVFAKLLQIRMIRLDENPWNCSCTLSKWPWRFTNRVKKLRLVEKCDYKYDKTPCTVQLEQDYLYNLNILPKCRTPGIYENWSVSQVVQQKLGCNKRDKHLKLRNYKNSVKKLSLEVAQNKYELESGNTNREKEIQFSETKNTDNKSYKQNTLDKSSFSKAQEMDNETFDKFQINQQPQDTDREILTKKLSSFSENKSSLVDKVRSSASDDIPNETI